MTGYNLAGVIDTEFDDIKVDFLYRYEKFIDEDEVNNDLRIASLKDIGAMKIQAVASRVSKKDYYDVFELLNVYTFADLIDFYTKMHPNHDIASVLKAMSDFKEADLEEAPLTLRSISWDVIKEKLSTEIKNYIHALQQKKIDAENERLKSLKEIIAKRKNRN